MNRPNDSGAMLSAQEALALLLAAARPVDAETVDTLDALGRVLAQDVTSQLDVPPADVSARDGYALRAADAGNAGSAGSAAAQAGLPVSQRVPAGHVPAPLAPGTAARIFTGAPVPPGADCVVMQEDVQRDGDVVRLTEAPRPGAWITPRGDDIRAGARVLTRGTRLTPQALGLAASVGIARLSVARPLKVAVFFTGDELMMPGTPLRPGAIYNSNRFTMRGLLERLGCEITDYGIVPDRLDATREALARAAQAHDIVITCGGVSVGEEDHVRHAVEAEGELDLWRIAIKPGKPLAFGRLRGAASGTCFFIGLPGNPVSSFVTFLMFVRPFLLRLQGVAQVTPRALPLRADFTQERTDARNEFMRARVNEAGGVEPFGNQSSAVLTSTVWGDGLIDNPPRTLIRSGDTVRFIPFSELLY